jgi:MFS-type transporter involved in bile tolerance (Atg22 family)
VVRDVGLSFALDTTRVNMMFGLATAEAIVVAIIIISLCFLLFIDSLPKHTAHERRVITLCLLQFFFFAVATTSSRAYRPACA